MVLRVRDLRTGQTFTAKDPAALVNSSTTPLGWAAPGVAWNPVSGELYFGTWADEIYGIAAIAPDAFGRPQVPGAPLSIPGRLLTSGGAREQLTDWFVSPDGTRLSYLRFDRRSIEPAKRKVQLREIISGPARIGW